MENKMENTFYFTAIVSNQLEQMKVDFVAAAVSTAEDLQAEDDRALECSRLLFVETGRVRLQLEQNASVLEPGSICLLPAGVPHRLESDPDHPALIKWCHFHTGLNHRGIRHLLGAPHAVSSPDPVETSRLMDRLMAASGAAGAGSRLRVKGALLELIGILLDALPEGALLPDAGKDMQKLDRVLQYIDRHLAEPITVEQLAKMAYFHPNYFISFFKGLMGCSPIQYVNWRRMELAQSLLRQGDVSVSEVSRRIGMKNYYFSRMFKAHTGLSPSQYRKLTALRGKTGGEERAP